MSGSVEVVTSELHVAADRLRASAQRLQDGLSSVDLETSNLLSSGWKGEAATAFGKYWDQWHNGAGQVVRALQTMSDALDEAGRVYAAQDEEAGRALGTSMQGGGGGGTGSGGGGGSPAGGAAPAAASSAGGSAAPAGGASGQTGGAGANAPSLADSMNLGQVMQPLSQLGAIPAQMAGQLTAGLVQAGQIAAGAAQQAVQAGIEIAQQAEAADAAEASGAAEAAGEEKPEAQAPEGASAGAGPGSAAPVEPERADPGTSGLESAPGRRL
ncbi:MAG: WXG100 family type VII secretion target [Mycolicibacterium neoaurum]|uniref:WXG100 family type VII secretion target n=1 Tax=Mycolicibacterium neoaurum TaxID=1795 RepID=UPI002FFC1FD3